ncbi:hypothetical protein [uncultured Pontibacter sp.]|uniref:hypothetical protein n=1 Tax=uncultured Pontibacter sp. TaxID=453356 RepID=UPI0026067B52|nr:hypothetical protein [uncultured Pontibacter sp.]
MSTLLISQQVEVRVGEAWELYRWIQAWLSKPIERENRLQPFEVLAATHLQKVARKLWSRLTKGRTAKGMYKITLTAPELLAIHEVIHEYPVELYNILSQIDRKVLNYDAIVECN